VRLTRNRVTNIQSTVTRELGSSPYYTADVDTVDEAQWYSAITQFDDANIYQTWAYDEVRCGRSNISHLLLRKQGRVVAAAQARIVRLPIIRAGIAYVRWGPLWKSRDTEADPSIFGHAIRAMRQEYVSRRGLVLRIHPALFQEPSDSSSASALAEEGFSFLRRQRVDRTLLLDLNTPLAELRRGLRPHWQRYLRVAEKNGLEIIEGSDDALFRTFISIYREMVGRKRFAEPNDIEDFRRIQLRLPAHLKMRIMLCRADSKVCAGLICSVIGNTAVYLFGATSNDGLKSRGSYLLHWKMIEWLKQNAVAVYDLNGISPQTNPGTYKFKADLCGANGRDVRFLGRYQSYDNVLSYLSVDCGEHLKAAYSGARTILSSLSDRASVHAFRARQLASPEDSVSAAPG